ncbi:IclR family transcriptional regulator [Streptomyces sp. SID11385]|uniref:IclR family transcriptional regulator n=1 Tax=Streptomyces sp. SID11385 TaxID=2706031 RepID=UPI0013CC3E91|nr:IclR family transcriptional regulator [Streptomyces sp. SID11385]NEA40289.1 IclR family transcriptional regulator [Streptomyces sp. SID11385]
MAPSPPAPSPSLVARVFALLRSFDADHRAQSLATLARRTGLPRSTALRLARRLVAEGALERREDGDFVIGLHLLEIASLAPRGHGLRAVAMPFMEDLFHVTGQHVLLAVREEGEALLVERLSAHDAGPVLFRVGGRMSLTGTGVGLVLLAHAPAEVQESALETYPPGEAGDGVRTPADLRRLLSGIRRDGYVVARRAWPDREQRTVAAPVRDARGVVSAISVVAPDQDFEPAAFLPAVRATARAVSRHLGAEGGTGRAGRGPAG